MTRKTLIPPGAVAAVGLTAIFECKASRPDYLRDCRSVCAITERLAALAARKARHEETLKIHYPSIRNGDSLFAEYETLNFERLGYGIYQRVLDGIGRLDTCATLPASSRSGEIPPPMASRFHCAIWKTESSRDSR